MSEQTYSIDQDLREAEAMAEALIPYVYQEELYGRVGAGGMFSGGNTPSLTIGALLMRLRRLQALRDQMSPAQAALLDKIMAQNNGVANEWRVHYTQKIIHEAESRLKSLDAYFAECTEDPRSCYGAYMPEALRRTILQEIANQLNEFNAPSAELDRGLRRADQQLRRFIRPSDFVWAAVLQPVYPREQYWWLYSRPPKA